MAGRAEPAPSPAEGSHAFDIDVTAPFVRARIATPEGRPASAPKAACDERIGGYRLCYVLATGGMATVYLAVTEDPSAQLGRRKEAPHRVVALKRIHPHLALQKEYVEMFLDEARITALIRHPNVCGVLDYGVVRSAETGSDTWWLAMELLAGEPLARVSAERAACRRDPDHTPAWPFVVARMLAGACEGLHAAHELRDTTGRALDVVHRDVSPHNLVVGFDGRVKVVDFGIAHAKERVHQTAAGFVKGKFAYMAPEQMRGQRVDRRADVWSLGVVLWEALAGRPLFRRKNDSETILAALADDVPPLRAIAAEVPPALASVAERALSMNPSARYATAEEMGRDLASIASTRDEDVARWMRHLFPDAEREHDRLVHLASARVPRSRSASMTDPLPRSVSELAPPSATSHRRPVRSAVYRTLGGSVTVASERVAWMVALFVIVAALVLALGMLLGSR
ncbi:MAG: serine/threonine protein kinase [Deltaproteobacteria bacterium]|nr:serine/threonine protein kinase [Deltaproteobacteria bacterium]